MFLEVIVQEPGQYVGSSVTYSTDDRIVVGLQPQHFTADPGARARPVNMRYCYFRDELTQSFSECIVRCHLSYIAKKCECDHKLIPSTNPLNEKPLRLCTVADLTCIQQNGGNYFIGTVTFRFYQRISEVSLFYMGNIIEESKDNVFNTTYCECYPTCDHTQYHAATFTDRLSGSDSRSDHIEVDVYFQEETLFSYRSTLHITMLDLMGELFMDFPAFSFSF